MVAGKYGKYKLNFLIFRAFLFRKQINKQTAFVSQKQCPPRFLRKRKSTFVEKTISTYIFAYLKTKPSF